MLLGHPSTRHTSSKMGKQLLSAILDLRRISWTCAGYPGPTQPSHPRSSLRPDADLSLLLIHSLDLCFIVETPRCSGWRQL